MGKRTPNAKANAKAKPETSRWFVANKTDARQIVERFHGEWPEAIKKAEAERIFDIIRGWPKKQLCGVLNTVALAEIEADREGEEFLAHVILQGFARNRAAQSGKAS